jgi:hypothetical protein
MESKLILINIKMGYNGKTLTLPTKVKKMKTAKVILGAGLLALVFGSADAAVDCGREYMKDPCTKDGYSVVETERFIRGPHNCMAIAHYFPGEEPEGYCGGRKGKNSARASSPVASVRD